MVWTNIREKSRIRVRTQDPITDVRPLRGAAYTTVARHYADWCAVHESDVGDARIVTGEECQLKIPDAPNPLSRRLSTIPLSPPRASFGSLAQCADLESEQLGRCLRDAVTFTRGSSRLFERGGRP